jgi:lysozyme family protein
MRDSFPKALAFCLKWEGGYSFDKDDPGGETFKGLTVRDHPELKDKIHNQTLTDEEAGAVYIRKYWLPAGCNDLPYPLDCVTFDGKRSKPVSGVCK